MYEVSSVLFYLFEEDVLLVMLFIANVTAVMMPMIMVAIPNIIPDSSLLLNMTAVANPKNMVMSEDKNLLFLVSYTYK